MQKYLPFWLHRCRFAVCSQRSSPRHQPLSPSLSCTGTRPLLLGTLCDSLSSLTEMAAVPCELENQYLSANVGGNCSLSVDGTCFPLLEDPGSDEGSEDCSLDLMPILLEEASHPAEAIISFQGFHDQDAYRDSMLPGGCKTSQQSTSQLAFLGFVGLPLSPEEQMCAHPQLTCQSFVDLQMETAGASSPCILDIDIDLENSGKLQLDDEPVGRIQNDGVLTGLLERQASLKSCQRLMQHFTNHISTLQKFISRDKSFTERVYDTPNNRWRKYKRAASFDSRKVVLVFSILSSLGTLVLIYLTLRVRQTVEGFVNV